MKHIKIVMIAILSIAFLQINHAAAISERGRSALIDTAIGAGIGGAFGGGEGAAIGAVTGATIGATAGAAADDDGYLDSLYRRRDQLEYELNRTGSDRRAEEIENEIADIDNEIAANSY